MLIRKLISFFAKQLYEQKYLLLKENLLTTYNKTDIIKQKIKTDLLEKILISGEDHRFKYHFGFDLIAIIRAIKNRLFYNKIEGASTIEQQLVRVLINEFDKTLKRKIQEIFLSTTLSDIVPRKEIPFIYLQVAYFGANMNGITQVFKNLKINESYFISEEIAANIIARIKYPEPKRFNKKRDKQIELRKNHLLKLFKKHNKRKLFKIYG